MNKFCISMLMSLPVVIPMFVFQPTANAQQPPADRTLSVLVVSVKPDMLHEWTDLVKNEVLPALKKAGIPSVTAMQTVFGNGNEFQLLGMCLTHQATICSIR